MSRYKAEGEWTPDPTFHQAHGIKVERADARDTKNGQLFDDGAYRVVVDGKPVRGKGGSVPFYGECAWMDAQRLANDLMIESAYA